MFRDEELRDEIQALFDEEQETYQRELTRDLLQHGHPDVSGRAKFDAGSKRIGVQQGFRIFTPNPPKSDEKKAAMRRFERKWDIRIIKERLLAGERPKMGGRGRPPTRWLEAAKELGIDLRAPVPTSPAA